MPGKDIISLVVTSLLCDKDHVRNKTIACDYDGTDAGLWYHLNPLLDNRLELFTISMQYGVMYGPSTVHIKIHTKGELVRSIFTTPLPLDQMATILSVHIHLQC